MESCLLARCLVDLQLSSIDNKYIILCIRTTPHFSLGEDQIMLFAANISIAIQKLNRSWFRSIKKPSGYDVLYAYIQCVSAILIVSIVYGTWIGIFCYTIHVASSSL